MQSLQDFFLLGMKRQLPEVYTPPLRPYTPVAINLGAGKQVIPGAVALDFPAWDANREPIPYGDASVDIVYAFHFLEHVDRPIDMLREIQRVLRPGGVANIVVPHAKAEIAFQDITHQTFFVAETIHNLLQNNYYAKDRDGWRFREHLTLGMFLIERNAALFLQLVRLEDEA
jgi:SAM-dependent methyltransferase